MDLLEHPNDLLQLAATLHGRSGTNRHERIHCNAFETNNTKRNRDRAQDSPQKSATCCRRVMRCFMCRSVLVL